MIGSPGKLVIELELDSKGAVVGVTNIEGALGKLDQQVQQSDNEWKNLWKQITFADIASNIITGAFQKIGSVFSESISLAMSAEEQESQFFQVFKDESTAALEFVDHFSEAIGRNEQDVISWMSSFQDTFVPLGFMRKEARQLTQQLVELGVDLGSFKDIPAADTFRDMQSTIVGNHETMRKYGVIITEATLNQELMRMGIEKGTKAATEQEKVMARVNIILRSTTDAHGDAIRTADSHANQLRRFQAVIKGVQIEVGKSILKVIDVLIDWREEIIILTTTLGGFYALLKAEAIKTALMSFAGSIKSFAGTAIRAISSINPVILGVTAAVGLATAGIKAYSDACDKAMRQYMEDAREEKKIRLELDYLRSKVSEDELKHIKKMLDYHRIKGKELPEIEKHILQLYEKRLRYFKQEEEREKKREEMWRAENKRIEELSEKMGILTQKGYEELNKEVRDLNISFDRHRDVISSSSSTAERYFSKATELSRKYLDNNRKIPGSLQKIIDMTKEWSTYIFANLPEVEKMEERLKKVMEINKIPELLADMAKGYQIINEEAEDFSYELDNIPDDKMIELAADLEYIADLIGDKTLPIMRKWGEMITSVAGLLGKLGLISDNTFESIVEGISSVYEVSGGISQGMMGVGQLLSGDILGGITGISRGIESIFSGITKIFSLFKGDGVGEAIDRERQYITISERMEEIIRETEKQVGDTHASISLHMAEIIKEAEIDADNFSDYVKRTQDVLADLDRGTLSVQQAQVSIGKAFNELIGEAQRLGQEGSRELLNLMGDLRNRGIEVAEIQDYVNKEIQSGIDAFGKYLDTFNKTGQIQENIRKLEEELSRTREGTLEHSAKVAELTEAYWNLEQSITDVKANFESMGIYALGMFHALVEEGATFVEAVRQMGPELSTLSEIAINNGLQVSGALRGMLDLQDFINQNETLVSRIDATTKMLESLGNTGYLTRDIFSQFQADAQAQFDALIEKTDDATLAYQLMGPELGKLAWYASQYGFQLDESTQKMIDQAEQHGVNMGAMIPPQEKMVSLLEELVRVLGGEIPYALDKFGKSAEENFGHALSDLKKFNTEIQGFKNPKFAIDILEGELPKGKGVPGFASGTGGAFIDSPGLFMMAEEGPERIFWQGDRIKVEPVRSPVTSQNIQQYRQFSIQYNQTNNFNFSGETERGDAEYILNVVSRGLRNGHRDLISNLNQVIDTRVN